MNYYQGRVLEFDQEAYNKIEELAKSLEDHKIIYEEEIEDSGDVDCLFLKIRHTTLGEVIRVCWVPGVGSGYCVETEDHIPELKDLEDGNELIPDLVDILRGILNWYNK